MSHPVYKPPLRFVLTLRLQKGGGVFAGHYGICIFGHSAGTHVTSIVAYSDFISKSSDYVLRQVCFQPS